LSSPISHARAAHIAALVDVVHGNVQPHNVGLIVTERGDRTGFIPAVPAMSYERLREVTSERLK